MDRYETEAKYNIAETCCASISIDELRELSEDKSNSIFETAKPLTYGAIRGSNALRENLSRLYSARAASPLSIENILSTPGAIQANYLCAYTLVGPGDHVICHYPTCMPPFLLYRSKAWTEFYQIRFSTRSRSNLVLKSTCGTLGPRMSGFQILKI